MAHRQSKRLCLKYGASRGKEKLGQREGTTKGNTALFSLHVQEAKWELWSLTLFTEPFNTCMCRQNARLKSEGEKTGKVSVTWKRVYISDTSGSSVNKEHESLFRAADCEADCLNEPCVQLGRAKCGQQDRYRSVNKKEFGVRTELQETKMLLRCRFWILKWLVSKCDEFQILLAQIH